MNMRFTLTMEDLNVNGTRIDQCTLEWTDDLTEDEILDCSQQWITSENFLTTRMKGLRSVGESALTIEPVEAN